MSYGNIPDIPADSMPCLSTSVWFRSEIDPLRYELLDGIHFVHEE